MELAFKGEMHTKKVAKLILKMSLAAMHLVTCAWTQSTSKMEGRGVGTN